MAPNFSNLFWEIRGTKKIRNVHQGANLLRKSSAANFKPCQTLHDILILDSEIKRREEKETCYFAIAGRNLHNLKGLMPGRQTEGRGLFCISLSVTCPFPGRDWGGNVSTVLRCFWTVKNYESADMLERPKPLKRPKIGRKWSRSGGSGWNGSKI